MVETAKERKTTRELEARKTREEEKKMKNGATLNNGVKEPRTAKSGKIKKASGNKSAGIEKAKKNGATLNNGVKETWTAKSGRTPKVNMNKSAGKVNKEGEVTEPKVWQSLEQQKMLQTKSFHCSLNRMG
jgi:hypothetical protein